ncbi:hypothetical protein V8D89_009815 [Ganoderma adspersum]
MNNTATDTLQDYTPRVHNALANVVSAAFLFGTLTVLSVVSAINIFHRGVKNTSTAFMLGSVIVLYASTAVHFGAVVAYSISYCRLLDDAVAALSSTSSTSAALTRFGRSTKIKSYIISVALAINVVIDSPATTGDVIVWWRVCVLWQKKCIIALGMVLIACTCALGILSAIHRSSQIKIYTQLLLHYGGVFGGLSGVMSLLTNVIATSLIGWKAWQASSKSLSVARATKYQVLLYRKHRRILREARRSSKRTWNTPTMRVLMLLIESGTIHSAFLAVAVAYNGVSRSSSALTSEAKFVSSTRVFLAGCFAPILAIYPTIVVFIVALNRSLRHNSLASPTDIISNIAFEGSSSAIHLSSRDAALSSHSDRPSDLPGNQSTEECRTGENVEEV